MLLRIRLAYNSIVAHMTTSTYQPLFDGACSEGRLLARVLNVFEFIFMIILCSHSYVKCRISQCRCQRTFHAGDKQRHEIRDDIAQIFAFAFPCGGIRANGGDDNDNESSGSSSKQQTPSSASYRFGRFYFGAAANIILSPLPFAWEFNSLHVFRFAISVGWNECVQASASQRLALAHF